MKALHEVGNLIPEGMMRLARNILDVDRRYRFRVRGEQLQYTIHGSAWTICSLSVITTYGPRIPLTTIEYANTRFDP